MSAVPKERNLSERYEPPRNGREVMYPETRRELRRDVPDRDPDRVSYMDSHRASVEFQNVKPGQVCGIYRDEISWLACVKTSQGYTLDFEFSTFRQAMDYAMEKAGL